MLSILPFLFSLSPHSRRLSSIFLVTHLCALKRTHPHIDRVVVAPAPSRAGGSEEKRRRSTAASETSRRRAFQWRFFPGTVPSHLLRSSQANERIAVPLVPLYRARMRARERGRGRRERGKRSHSELEALAAARNSAAAAPARFLILLSRPRPFFSSIF